MINSTVGKYLIPAAFILCLFPFINAPIALLLGMVVATLAGNPYKTYTTKYSKLFLQYAIVGMGFGMNAQAAFKAGIDGFWLTIFTIIIALSAGYVLGQLLGVKKHLRQLISSGTAICGGSAIAAVAPVIEADNEDISVSLGIVFLLNALALFVFPPLGHFFNLSQHQFGVWSAIAIHDTSSVVGAAARYGAEALQTATTIKLARALWIIPLTLFMAMQSGKKKKISFPRFILFFVIAMLLNTYVLPDSFASISQGIYSISRRLLVVTLFLIGTGLSLQTFKQLSLKPFMLGVLLWIILSITGLLAVYYFV